MIQEALEESGYQRIREWLHKQCGMNYQDKKRDLLTHRMQRVCERWGISNLDLLAEKVELGLDREIQFAVLHAASTNHTFFFREPQILDFFKNTILPDLPQKGARIWSAAASTGDEAYTLAIMMAEARGRHWIENNVSILGTDISEVVIGSAEMGIYGSSHLDQMPPNILPRYFSPLGMDQYQVQEDIRRVCMFRRLNLKANPYPFKQLFHTIFCRNVLYYFDRAHQRSTVEALYDVTEPGGWLLTSVTESLRDMDTRWITIQGGVYRKAF